MYFIGDLKDFQGKFWLHVNFGLHAILERNLCIRYDSAAFRTTFTEICY
jgi:hypothetical protein